MLLKRALCELDLAMQETGETVFRARLSNTVSSRVVDITWWESVSKLKPNQDGPGLQLNGRILAYHGWGPGFSPQHHETNVHFLCFLSWFLLGAESAHRVVVSNIRVRGVRYAGCAPRTLAESRGELSDPCWIVWALTAVFLKTSSIRLFKFSFLFFIE